MYQDAEKSCWSWMSNRRACQRFELAAQQTIEIAKAISLNVRALIMDEPTASLSAHEVEHLFTLTRSLRDQGVSILFISHRMEEVFEIADRVTIFRDGRWISTLPSNEITRERAIRDMVGRKVEDFFARSERERAELLMSVSSLMKENVFYDINFDVHRGEVLGFAGLVGSRRTDVGLALFGIELPIRAKSSWRERQKRSALQNRRCVRASPT
jgi:rhamnose transport system ATP-binding protein